MRGESSAGELGGIVMKNGLNGVRETHKVISGIEHKRIVEEENRREFMFCGFPKLQSLARLAIQLKCICKAARILKAFTYHFAIYAARRANDSNRKEFIGFIFLLVLVSSNEEPMMMMMKETEGSLRIVSYYLLSHNNFFFAHTSISLVVVKHTKEMK